MLSAFDDYTVLEELARGGMGVVFKAQQHSLDRIVALKVILAGRLASPQDVERFQREARAAARLDHPGVVSVYEVGRRRDTPYFTMGYVDGPSLSQVLRNGPLEPRRAAAIVAKVARAIDYAHSQGIVHRDLKPANILLDRGDVPRITDFGLAKRVDAGEGLTLSGDVLGTPEYMAPEQAAGESSVGSLSDVYAVGATLYSLVTGRPPFRASNRALTLVYDLRSEPVAPRLLNPDIPKDLEVICLKCLAKDPTHRYRSAGELADDLGRFLRHDPIAARPPHPLIRARKYARRHPARVLVLVSLILMAGLGLLWYREAALATTARDAIRLGLTRLRLEAARTSLALHEQSVAELWRGHTSGRDPGELAEAAAGLYAQLEAGRAQVRATEAPPEQTLAWEHLERRATSLGASLRGLLVEIAHGVLDRTRFEGVLPFRGLDDRTLAVSATAVSSRPRAAICWSCSSSQPGLAGSSRDTRRRSSPGRSVPMAPSWFRRRTTSFWPRTVPAAAS